MEEQIIFIYSICVDFLIRFGIKNDVQCKMNSAEVMTVAIVAALFFGGNYSMARFSCLRRQGIYGLRFRRLFSRNRSN